MTTISDKTQHYKTIHKTCLTANIVYMIVHAFYLVLFIIARLDILVYVDAVVIALYGLCFWLLQKRKYYIYALVCGNTFLAFISVTTVMMGFGSGFHFYLIGLCVVSYFTSYFSKKKHVGRSLIWVGLSVAIYLVLYFVTRFNQPYYAVPEWLEITLFTVHAIAVFVFVAAYMTVFLKYALSLERRIINESRTDELTQINNRYSLYDFFDGEESKSSMVLALFDIDDFKHINDTYGHVTGDLVLKKVAELTAKTLSDCFVCRYGGEEFVIVLDDDEQGSALARLESLREAIASETFKSESGEIHITVTIGAAKYPKDASLEKWVSLADEKMYRGKESGKNKTVI